MSGSLTTDPLNWTAAVLMIVNGVFGVFCNSVIIHHFCKSSSDRTSFNAICTIRAVVNCIILGLGFLATFVPLTILGDTLFPPSYHAIIISIVLSLYTGLQDSGFLIAINRFCAMFFTLLYAKYFTVTVTFVAASIIFIYRIYRMGQEIDSSIQTQCFNTYSSEYLTWSPSLDPKCWYKYDTVVDGSALILGALILINIVTFVKIYFFYKRTIMESKEMRQRIRKNKILFIQTVLQDFTYVIDVIFTFKLSGLISTRYWTFISGTFIWECVHSSDGLIMIMFNEKLTFLKMSIFRSPSVSAVAQSTVWNQMSINLPTPIN